MRWEGIQPDMLQERKQNFTHSPNRTQKQVPSLQQSQHTNFGKHETPSSNKRRGPEKLDVKQLVKEIHRIADLSKSTIMPANTSEHLHHDGHGYDRHPEKSSRVKHYVLDEDRQDLQGVIDALNTPPGSHKKKRPRVEIDREHKPRRRSSRIGPSPQESSFSPNLAASRQKKDYKAYQNKTKIASSSMVIGAGELIGTETGASEVAQRIFSKLDNFLNKPPQQPKPQNEADSNLKSKPNQISQSSSHLKYKENVVPSKGHISRADFSDVSNSFSKSPIQDGTSLVCMKENPRTAENYTDAVNSRKRGCPPPEFTKPAWVSFGSRSRSKISSSSADSKESDNQASRNANNPQQSKVQVEPHPMTALALNDSMQSLSKKSDYRLRYRPTKAPVSTNRIQALQTSLSLAHRFRAEQTHNRSGISGRLNTSIDKSGSQLFGKGWEHQTTQNILGPKPEESLLQDIPQKTGSSFRQSSFSVLKLLNLKDPQEVRQENAAAELKHSRTVKSLPRRGVIALVPRANHEQPPVNPNTQKSVANNLPAKLSSRDHDPAEQTVYLDLKGLLDGKISQRDEKLLKRVPAGKEQDSTNSKLRKYAGDVVRHIELEEETDQKVQMSPSHSRRAVKVSRFEPHTEEPKRPFPLVSDHKVSNQAQTAATNKLTETGGIQALVSNFSHGLSSLKNTVSVRKKRLNSGESIEPLNLHIVEHSEGKKPDRVASRDADLQQTEHLIGALKHIVSNLKSSSNKYVADPAAVQSEIQAVSRELDYSHR